MRVPWAARRSNQFILKEISPDPEGWDGEGGGRGGAGWGTHAHPWQIHVDVWQNQYNIVK